MTAPLPEPDQGRTEEHIKALVAALLAALAEREEERETDR